jgi:hypothetical protein
MDKIERVPRAICLAKESDTDSNCGRGPLVTVTRSSSPMAVSYTQWRQPLPNWRTFEAEASVFVAAHHALTEATEEPPARA